MSVGEGKPRVTKIRERMTSPLRGITEYHATVEYPASLPYSADGKSRIEVDTFVGPVGNEGGAVIHRIGGKLEGFIDAPERFGPCFDEAWIRAWYRAMEWTVEA